MIFNNFDSYNRSNFRPTVCIIGSGPAGISLALQLEKLKIPCLIIEAGGVNYSAESQDAYNGNVIGDEYPDLKAARLRYFGGTSNHWAGWCHPLDEIDFEPRKGVKNSGWPIKKKDLDPYSETTESILDIPAIKPNSPIDDNLEEAFFRFSPPVRFGMKYQNQIKNSSLISLLLNSPVTDLVPENEKISHANIYTPLANQKIYAKYFCLCTGGIENSRILLWSNQLHNGGVVPHSKTLGKYWMEHPIYYVGNCIHYSFTRLRSKHDSLRFYTPSAKFLRTYDIDNFGLRVQVTNQRLAKTLIKDAMCIAPNLFSKLLDKPYLCTTRLQLAWAQIPSSDNRIELGSDKDSLGIPKVNLFWKKQPQDRYTAEMALKLFGSYLIKEDLGRVKVSSWLANKLEYPKDDPEKIGYHHMGGTRMASSSAEGIVDANCKVFGVNNLFIGGSSVFATGGHVNPTYGIVQLALRLGDHLADLEKIR